VCIASCITLCVVVLALSLCSMGSIQLLESKAGRAGIIKNHLSSVVVSLTLASVSCKRRACLPWYIKNLLSSVFCLEHKIIFCQAFFTWGFFALISAGDGGAVPDFYATA